jgi:hypothetical protein
MSLVRIRGKGACAAALSVATVLGSSLASASPPSKAQCAAADENGEALRKEGKLREASKELHVCVAKACPAVVRQDCEQTLAEVERTTPTLRVVVTDKGGRALTGAVVTVDGSRIAGALDGPIPLDPGAHDVVVEVDRVGKVERAVTLVQGVKDREERFVLAPADDEHPRPAPPAAAPSASPHEHGEPSSTASTASTGSTQRTLGLVAGGLGIAGIGLGAFLGLKASSTYNDALKHCPTATTCDDAGVQGSSSAHAQATGSTIAFVAGGALALGGALLWITAPSAHGAEFAIGGAPRTGGVSVSLRRTW